MLMGSEDYEGNEAASRWISIFNPHHSSRRQVSMLGALMLVTVAFLCSDSSIASNTLPNLSLKLSKLSARCLGLKKELTRIKNQTRCRPTKQTDTMTLKQPVGLFPDHPEELMLSDTP